MPRLWHYCRGLIPGLAVAFCLFGTQSSAHGQQGFQGFGGLHAAQLHPSRFVYGTGGFARPINPIVPLSTRVSSAAFNQSAPTAMTQGLTPGVAQSNVIGPLYDNSPAADSSYPISGPLYYLSPPASSLQPREDLQRIISQSSALSSRNAIQVVGSGNEVVLRGSVISDYDRRLAEALLLLSPSVQSVRNELTVGQ